MNRIHTRAWLTFVFIATFMVALCCPGVAHALDGHITGQVTGPDGLGIEGITVVPLYLDGGGQWFEDWGNSAATNASGDYDLGPLPPGTYRIRFIDQIGLVTETPGDYYYAYQYWPNANWADAGEDIVVGDGIADTGKNQGLYRGARITGTVTADDGGALLEGIEVAAAVQFGGGWPGVVGDQTDASGYFDLTGLPLGTYTVQFRDPTGAYAQELYDDDDNAGMRDYGNAIWFDVETGLEAWTADEGLAAGSSIEGVLTGGGSPLVGGTVWIADYVYGSWNWLMTAQTGDPLGDYAFRGLQAGDYRLMFEDPSGAHVPEVWADHPGMNIEIGDTITLGVGQALTGYDADLGPAGFISGMVSAEGIGALSGIGVEALVPGGPGEWFTVAWTQTEGDGSYTLSGLATGDYCVQFYGGENWMNQWYSATDPGTRDPQKATPVSVTAGDTTAGIHATMVPAGRITGAVYGEGAGALGGIHAVAIAQSGDIEWWDWRADAWTEPDGTFTIGGLDPGTYRVFFEDPAGDWAYESYTSEVDGGDVGAPEDGSDVVVPEGTLAVIDDETLGLAGWISGTVYGDGVPVGEGMPVQAMEPGYFHEMVRTWTEPDGTYTLKGLRPPSLFVGTDGDETWSGLWYPDAGSPPGAEPVDVTADFERTGIDLYLSRAPHVVGTVTGAGEFGPIEGARVIALELVGADEWNPGWWQEYASTSTDASGTYVLSGIQPGQPFVLKFEDGTEPFEWAMEFYQDQIAPRWAQEFVLSTGDIEANAELAPAGHVTGHVTADGTGEDLEGITVAAGPYEWDGQNGWYDHIASTSTDASGTYDIGGLPAGTYRVQFWDNEGMWLGETYSNAGDWTQGTDVTLAEGETRENVDAALGAAVRITGMVTDPGGVGIQGIHVLPLEWRDDGTGGGWWDERHDLSVMTEGDGSYVIPGQAPGFECRLVFRDDNEPITWAAEYYNNAIAPRLGQTITLGESDYVADAQLAPAGHITGHVIADGAGEDLEGIRVGAGPYEWDGQNGWYDHIVWASTDASGTYDLGGLPAGTYRVQFWDDAGMWLGETYDDQRDWTQGADITLAEGETYATSVDAQLAPAARLTGTVSGLGEPEPLANINVRMFSREQDEYGNSWFNWFGDTWTEDDGVYSFGGMEPGSLVRLQFIDHGGLWATEFHADKIAPALADDIELMGGENVVDAELVVASHITGHVTAEGSGEDLEGIMVGAGPYEWDGENGWYDHIAWTSTDASGTYDLGGLPAGTFRVQFWDDAGMWLGESYDNVGEWPQGTDITLGAGETYPTSVDAELAPAARIVGTVTGAGGAGVLGGISVVPVEWQDDGEGGGWWRHAWERSAHTGPDGTYVIGGLDPSYDCRLMFLADSGQWATEFWNDKMTATGADPVPLAPGDTDCSAELAVGRHITGRVTSDGVNGIGNINVAAGPFDVGAGFYEHVAWTTTNPDGTYDLGGLPAGVFRVQFWDDNNTYASEVYDNAADWTMGADIDLTVETLREGVDAELQAGPRITGVVSGEGTGTIEGIEVVPMQLDGYDEWGNPWWNHRWDRRVFTNASGTYEITGLEPGMWGVMFVAGETGWASEYWNDAKSQNAAEQMMLAAGDVAICDAALVRGGAISGTVSGAGEPPTPLENVHVVAIDPNTGEHLGWTESVGGAYTIFGLQPGSYLVQSFGTWDWTWELWNDTRDWEQADQVTVVADEIAGGIDFVLDPACRISGTVTPEGGGSFGDVGAAATVPLRWADQGDWGYWEEMWDNRGDVNPDGTYTIGGLEPGTYRVRFQADPEQWANEVWNDKRSPMLGDDIVLGVGEHRTGIDAVLSPACTISGTVTGEGAGVLEQIVVSAAVFDPVTDLWDEIQWTETSVEGTYTLTGLPEGEYAVSFWDGGGNWLGEQFDSVYDWHEATPVFTSVADPAVGVNAELAPAAHMSGTILGDDGESVFGLAGMNVELYGYNGEGWDWIDWRSSEIDGSYDFGGLWPGSECTIWVTDPNREWGAIAYSGKSSFQWGDHVMVPASGIDVTMQRAGMIVGAIYGGEGTSTPIANWDIEVGPWDASTGGWDSWWDYAEPGEEPGTFVIRGLTPGVPYRLLARDRDGQYADLFWENGIGHAGEGDDVVVTPGGVTPIEFHLPLAAHITGRVVDEAGIGVPGVMVFQYNESPYTGWDDFWNSFGGVQASTDASGNYDMAGLYPGTFRVGFGGTDTLASEYWDDASVLQYGTDIEITTFGEVVESIDATLSAAGSIEGTVTDKDGVPIEGVVVEARVWRGMGDPIYELFVSGDGSPDAVTDANGHYSIDNIRPQDEVFVEVWDPQENHVGEWYEDATGIMTATGVHVPAGGVRENVDFELADAGFIDGTVTLENPIDSLAPINAVVFRAVEPDGGWEWVTSMFGEFPSDGYYHYGGLAAGDYYIQFFDNDGRYASEFYNNALIQSDADPVTVTAGMTTTADAALELAGYITGTVKHGVDPVPNIDVEAQLWDETSQLWVNAGGWAAQTQLDGTYRLPVRAGTYRVLFEDGTGPYAPQYYSAAPSGYLASDVVVVKSQDTPMVDASLTLAASLTVNVTDEAAAPLDGITVEVWYSFDSTWTAIAAGETSGGAWTAEDILPGDYKVHLVDSGGQYVESWYTIGGPADDLASAEAITVAEGTPHSISHAMERFNSAPVAVDDPALGEMTSSVLLIPDAVGLEHLGTAVAIDGDTVVVSAVMENNETGGVYVFTRSAGLWTLEARLAAPDGAESDHFGEDVAISGDTIAVGAPWDDDDVAGSNVGSVYVFTRAGGVWTPQSRLIADDAAVEDGFGTSLALEGDTLVTGAPKKDSFTGGVYVFTRSGSVWTQRTRLMASDAGADDNIGRSVALSGDTVVAGAGDWTLGDEGWAVVFTRTGETWAEQQKLTASDGEVQDDFGHAVAVSGDTVMIGARWDDDLGYDSGSVYLFTRSGGTWTEQGKLHASDATTAGYFGRSIALSGEAAVIGGYRIDRNVGAAYVFTRCGGSWTEDAILGAQNPVEYDGFGSDVALSGGTVVVGVPDASDGAPYSGSAYVYAPGPTTTIEDTELTIAAPGVLANDYDIDGDPLTAALVMGPAYGQAVLYPDGSFTYTPLADFYGTDTFTYTATDGVALSDIATVTVIVTPVNDAPVAVDDEYTTAEDTTLTVPAPGMLESDSDVDGDSLEATVVTGPKKGSLATALENGWFEYTPDPNYCGTDTFTYKVNDGELESNVATVTINVTPVNDPPVADNDSYLVNEDDELAVLVAEGVLIGDTDVDSGLITADRTGGSGPNHGELVFQTTGAFTYAPDSDFYGVDTFTYRAYDGTLYSEYATVTITVTNVNDPPMAVDDDYVVAEDMTLVGVAQYIAGYWKMDEGSGATAADLTTNDNDGSLHGATWGTGRWGECLSFDGVNDYVEIADDDALDFASTSDFSMELWVRTTSGGMDRYGMLMKGEFSPRYGMSIGFSNSPADLMWADKVNVWVGDWAYPSTTAGVVNDGQWHHVAAVIDRDHGVSIYIDGQLDVTHEVDTSALLTSNALPLTIGAIDHNTDPIDGELDEVGVYDRALTANEIAERFRRATQGGVYSNDSDVDACDTLEVTVSVEPTHGVVSMQPNGLFTYAPDPGYNGEDAFEYELTDGNGGTDTGRVRITITPVNDPPVADAGGPYNASEGTAVQLDGSGSHDPDLPADDIETWAWDLDGDLDFIDESGEMPSHTFPDDGEYGVRLRVTDGGGLTDEAGTTVTVVNVAPNVEQFGPGSDPFEGQVASFVATFTDPGVEDTHTATIDWGDGSAAEPMEVTGTGGSVGVAQASHAYGDDGEYDVTVTIEDDDAGTDSVSFTVTVSNVAPVLGAISLSDSTPETGQQVDFSAAFTDAGTGDTHTAVWDWGDETSTTASVDEAEGSGTVTGSHAYVLPGTYTATCTVTDSDGDTVEGTVLVTVTQANRAPYATDDSYTTDEDTDLNISAPGFLVNDGDVDGDAITAILVADPLHGGLWAFGQGNFIYRPNPNWSGTDVIKYKVNDGELDSNVATITITVTPVDDGPPVAVDDSYTIAEDSVLTTPAPGVLVNDTDPDGDTLAAIKVTNPAHGTVTLDENGSFTFTPAANWHGIDSFTYKANDGTADSDIATVTITVTAVNDAPVAVADAYSMAEDTVLNVSAPGVLGNDTDVEDAALTMQVGTQPTHGTLAPDADGSFNYTPVANFFGVDTFTYRASDGTAWSAYATVTITVTDVADELIVVPLEGDNRYETAIAVSREAFPGSAANVVLATGENWPDALGGAALAGALDGPILLTKKTALPSEIKAEIMRLEATKVYILGSEAAVSRAVASAVDGIPGVSIERIAGNNRYETARAVAERAIAIQGSGYDGTAFIATGLNFPDALGASPLSAARGWPIYLSNPTQGDNAALISVMDARGVTRALVLGGTNVVSSSIENKARTTLGAATRLKGDNRYQTAVAVASFGVGNAGLSWDKLALATGTNFPDALAGGVIQGRAGSVMLLTPGTRLDETVRLTLVANKATINEVRYLGSEDAISRTVRQAVEAALQ